jgi:hypothetical protein
MRRKQTWALALMGAAGGLNASMAGHTTSTTVGTVSGTLHGSNGTTYRGYGTTTSRTETYDYGAQAAAQAREQARINETAQGFARINAATEQGLLKDNTLFPGQAIEGSVVADLDFMYATKFKVVIPIGAETHEINFIPKR